MSKTLSDVRNLCVLDSRQGSCSSGLKIAQIQTHHSDHDNILTIRDFSAVILGCETQNYVAGIAPLSALNMRGPNAV